jgi:hypothetical protein
MRTRIFVALAAVAASALALTGCAPAPAPAPTSTDCAGVRVVVNFALLGQSGSPADVSACAPLASGTETVADALAAVKVTTEGTAKYGDQVVCRVNGFPAADEPFTVPGHDAYTETCATMAPEYAYWALWIKSGAKAWDYAAEGVSTQKVAPGDSIGIVFTTGGATPTPGN